jgi:hypothetical protein
VLCIQQQSDLCRVDFSFSLIPRWNWTAETNGKHQQTFVFRKCSCVGMKKIRRVSVLLLLLLLCIYLYYPIIIIIISPFIVLITTNSLDGSLNRKQEKDFTRFFNSQAPLFCCCCLAKVLCIHQTCPLTGEGQTLIAYTFVIISQLKSKGETFSVRLHISQRNKEELTSNWNFVIFFFFEWMNGPPSHKDRQTSNFFKY